MKSSALFSPLSAGHLHVLQNGKAECFHSRDVTRSKFFFSQEGRDDQHLIDDDTTDLLEMLATPYDEVYQVSADGKRYLSPAYLVGVPVEKISESSDYWVRGWHSLDRYLAEESENLEMKKKYALRVQGKAPGEINRRDKDEYKRYCDNSSKHIKIREIFGSGTNYHPNQLVSKSHLPDYGLCDQELMYTLACRVSDMRVLYARGELGMDPWDFLRWRVQMKIKEVLRQNRSISAKSCIRGLIRNLCADGGPDRSSSQYEDHEMRKAVLRAARVTGRLQAFGSRRVQKPCKYTRPGSRVYLSRAVQGCAKRSISKEHDAERREARRKDVLARQSRSTYAGVNAFRAQKMANK